ncbi:MAG: hypothetical protein ACJ70V_08795 [Nitrososphaera sp.]
MKLAVLGLILMNEPAFQFPLLARWARLNYFLLVFLKKQASVNPAEKTSVFGNDYATKDIHSRGFLVMLLHIDSA